MPAQQDNTFLDEAFLRRLENLKILSHRGITGLDRGEHTSWRSGPSLEFLDYRKYHIGDDFRYIDWNVFGRLDKLFIKLFRSEENQGIHILLDTSRSMGLGKPAKDLYSKKITAALSYIGLTHMDHVRVTGFSNKLGDVMIPVKSRQAYSRILDYLHTIRPKGKTNINISLSKYAETCERTGIAIIISDLMDPNGFEKGLEILHRARWEISVIQVLDHQEIFPSDTGNIILKEIEKGDTINLTIDQTVLAVYQQKFQEYIDSVKSFCLDNGIDYYLCDTSIPFEDLLLDYIAAGRLFQRLGT